MTILVVDNNAHRLQNLTENLRIVFPKDVVESTIDPLMAGKLGINNQVDILFAELVMKRMNGIALGNLIRRKNPKLKIFLIGSEDQFGANRIVDSDNINGLLVQPVTTEMLKDISDKCTERYILKKAVLLN